MYPGATGEVAVPKSNFHVLDWPVPWMAKSYGFSSESLLATLILAVFNPAVPGANFTWKLTLPPGATGETGWATTVKSAAFTPMMLTLGLPVRFNAPPPVFRIVNVRVTLPPTGTGPKSVPSSGLGVLSPSTITCPLPCNSTSGYAPATSSIPRMVTWAFVPPRSFRRSVN